MYSDVLSKVAEKKNWKKFDVDTNFNYEKGNGFLGEFFMGSITNKETNEKLNLAIKKAFKNKKRREEIPMRLAYLNEINFYSNIVPCYERFLKEKGVQDDLEMVAKYYIGIQEELNETLVLNNLRNLGYDILGREAFLDDELIRFIFKTYGRFHALSFVLKEQKPEIYKNLTDGIIDLFERIGEFKSFFTSLAIILSDSLNCLDGKLKKYCSSFFENGEKYLMELKDYKGKYSCIVHGDCWSNNMMFKYKNNTVEGIKLIDFQVVRVGTPVFDLSYFFYAGASKELYKNLETYLKIYYDSFSNTASLLGSDANQIFPFDSLKQDWKAYCKYGLLMGLFVIKMKLTSSADVDSMTDDANEGFMETFDTAKIDNTIFKQKVQDLVEHFYENGFI